MKHILASLILISLTSLNVYADKCEYMGEQEAKKAEDILKSSKIILTSSYPGDVLYQAEVITVKSTMDGGDSFLSINDDRGFPKDLAYVFVQVGSGDTERYVRLSSMIQCN